METRNGDITALLRQWSGGDPDALERLLPLIYEDLRNLAERFFRQERTGHTLQATALVHELYLRMVDQDRAQWTDREHFFRVAAKIMRRIMVDHARRRASGKRGNATVHLAIDDDLDAAVPADRTVLTIDEVLNRFAAIDPHSCEIVEMRYFGGFELDEIADLMRVSRTTVKRKWTAARMWLHRELKSELHGSEPLEGD